MDPKIKVLILTNIYPTEEKPGDLPQIRDQIEALRILGVSVDLVYINRYQNKWQNYAKAAWCTSKLSFRGDKYDLVHAYYGHCGLVALLQSKYPVVVTFLGSDLLAPKDGKLGKFVAKSADGVIVQSEEMKKIIRREDAEVIPFGINTDLFKPYPKKIARKELGLRKNEKLVLFPWNPNRAVKRFDLVCKAIQIVKLSIPETRIISIYDQPHETVARYMNACDAMVLTSEHEGSPMAVREAMACNLPIVSVDVGDVRKIIANSDGCFLCSRQSADIAENLILALKHEGGTQGAHCVVKADVEWGANEVIKLYHRVLGSQR